MLTVCDHGVGKSKITRPAPVRVHYLDERLAVVAFAVGTALKPYVIKRKVSLLAVIRIVVTRGKLMLLNKALARIFFNAYLPAIIQMLEISDLVHTECIRRIVGIYHKDILNASYHFMSFLLLIGNIPLQFVRDLFHLLLVEYELLLEIEDRDEQADHGKYRHRHAKSEPR